MKQITTLKNNEVFVFGSNANGNHAGGAARQAVESFGAIMGQAEGLQGQSYGIVTLDKDMRKVSLDYIEEQLQTLAAFAEKKAGAEYGYKEAIEQAKEWLKEKLNYIPMESFLTALETDMNKLWED